MSARFPVLKAGTAFFFSAVAVVAGAAPVLYFVALLVWQFTVRFQSGSWVPLPVTVLFTDHSFAFIPEFPWAGHKAVAFVLDRLHVALVPALLGCAVAALGVRGALRQIALTRTQKQRTEDRLRRMQDYRRDDSRPDGFEGRREPFIGAGSIDRNTDRRVA